jgi:hypothetical protein
MKTMGVTSQTSRDITSLKTIHFALHKVAVARDAALTIPRQIPAASQFRHKISGWCSLTHPRAVPKCKPLALAEAEC